MNSSVHVLMENKKPVKRTSLVPGRILSSHKIEGTQPMMFVRFHNVLTLKSQNPILGIVHVYTT